MYKKFKALGQLGSHVLKTAKDYYKAGGKKTTDIMKESKVSRDVAKSDIKFEIKRIEKLIDRKLTILLKI